MRPARVVFFAVSFCKRGMIFASFTNQICCAARLVFHSEKMAKKGVSFDPKRGAKINSNLVSKTMSKVVGYSLIFFLELVPSPCLDTCVEFYKKRLYLGDC